ncbi:MAG: hypothetical protein IJY99_01450 [Alphaproteobacteria bacterium]|nr:hypothetical protein [Alphaproteobacteria bacterium]
MKKEEFLSKLKEALHTQTNLLPETNLNDLEEWDSLAKLEVQVFLEEFGVKLSYADIDQLKTVQDIMSRVTLGD